VLIISSIGVFAYSISAITTYFVAGEFIKVVRKSRNQTLLEKLDNHVIICGMGRVGSKVVQDLQAYDERFVLLEKDIQKIPEDITPKMGAALNGDATQDEVLLEAGIGQAKSLITTLPNDADNLYVVLTARELNPKLTIISRGSKQESVRKLRIAGANNVIMPDDLRGAHMASLAVNPDVLEFLDHISIQGSAEVNLEEVGYQDLPASLKNKSISMLLDDGRFKVNIIGYKKQDGEFVINPSGEAILDLHSKFFVLGEKNEI
jgi:voltage-gated potassium channel